MNREQIEVLRSQAEKRCTEIFEQYSQLGVELERVRGEFRAYDSLLLNWPQEDPEPIVEEMDVFPTVNNKPKRGRRKNANV